MNLFDVKPRIYIDVNKKKSLEDLKFKVGDHVIISKYKNIFAKTYTPNCFEDVFIIKQVKNNVCWTYLISDLNGKEVFGAFYEKEL